MGISIVTDTNDKNAVLLSYNIYLNMLVQVSINISAIFHICKFKFLTIGHSCVHYFVPFI